MTVPEQLPPDKAPPKGRGEQTRQHLVETTLRLFREHGFEGTTMRMVATEAGVSVGNAYYHFPSKDHLVQAFYEQTQLDHERASEPVLASQTSFEARLHGVLRARVDTMLDDHDFAAQFLRVASDPRSPLSPFSADSAPTRDAAIALYAQVVEGSDVKASGPLRAALPELLWLYSMGVVLFWVYDDTPGAQRTYLLVDRTVPLVARLVALARYRLLRSTVDEVLALVRDLRG